MLATRSTTAQTSSAVPRNTVCKAGNKSVSHRCLNASMWAGALVRMGNNRHTVMSAKTQAEAGGKLISKVEIPAFIPRPDISDQLLRWALIEIQEGGVASVGCPCKVGFGAR